MPDDGDKKVGPKKGGTLDKYKWWIVGGLAVIAVLVFYFVNRNNQSAAGNSAAGTQTNAVPTGSEGFIAGTEGPPGPAGPAGQRGPRGWRGKRGKRGPGDNDKGPKPHKHHCPEGFVWNPLLHRCVMAGHHTTHPTAQTHPFMQNAHQVAQHNQHATASQTSHARR